MERALIDKGIILKKSTTINLAKFSKVRSYRCIVGVDLDLNNVIIFFRDAKSRFIVSDFQRVEMLANLVLNDMGIITKKRYLFINSQLCSKAQRLAKERGWKCYF